MAVPSIPIGFVPVIGTSVENLATVTPIALAASTGLVLPLKPIGLFNPTQFPTGQAGTTGWGIKGPILCHICIEGTAACRYTWNGVTPTAAIGQLTDTPTATNPVFLQFIATGDLGGIGMLTAFRIIQVAAAASMTYQFYAADVR